MPVGCRRTRTAGARTSPTTSRRRSSSIARTALSGSSPATELAPMRHPLATTHGGARSAPAAHLGSGRSRPAGPRRQTRLEAQALGTVPIRALLGPEFTPHLGVETVENLCRTAGDWAGSRPGDFTTPDPVVGTLKRGTCGEILGKSANFCGGLAFARPSVWRDAGRMGSRRPLQANRPTLVLNA